MVAPLRSELLNHGQNNKYSRRYNVYYRSHNVTYCFC